jgi:hypothetical protein
VAFLFSNPNRNPKAPSLCSLSKTEKPKEREIEIAARSHIKPVLYYSAITNLHHGQKSTSPQIFPKATR